MSATWRAENAAAIETAWERTTCFGFSMICNACGGPSISTCACAKERFMERMNPEELARLQAEFREDEKELERLRDRILLLQRKE